MKKIKYLVFLVLFLFVIKLDVKAYDIFTSSYATYTEKEMYEYFSQIEGFNINKNNNIYCYRTNSLAQCYALTDKSVNSLSYPNYMVTLTDYNDCYYYYVKLSKYLTEPELAISYSCSYNDGKLTNITTKTLSNFNFNFMTDSDNLKYNVLDFSPYMSPEEEKEELEITIKGTQILNFILDKSKNIYEVLINNQIFQLCLGVLISYLIFMVICRFKK